MLLGHILLGCVEWNSRWVQYKNEKDEGKHYIIKEEDSLIFFLVNLDLMTRARIGGPNRFRSRCLTVIFSSSLPAGRCWPGNVSRGCLQSYIFIFSACSFYQCSGSVSFWYGSGNSDPFRGNTAPGPTKNRKKKLYHTFFLLITQRMIYY